MTVMPVALVPGLNKTHLESSVFRYVQETLGLKLMGSYRVVRAMKPDALDQQHLNCGERPGAGGGAGYLSGRRDAAGVCPLPLSLRSRRHYPGQ
jgi:hypothetical protein